MLRLALFLVAFVPLTADPSFVFSNGEIRVDFAARFAVSPEAKSIAYGDYLPKPKQTIEFCAWQPQDPNVQQVGPSESGFLCELHQMPLQSVESALELVQKASKVKRKDRGIFLRVGLRDVAGHKILHWRFQASKTRLDHYLLTGKKHSYLFVSSAYGSNGSIEAILARTKIE